MGATATFHQQRAGLQFPLCRPSVRSRLLHAKLRPNATVGLMAPNDQYFLGHSSVEQKRLQQQAGELAEESARLFDQIGLKPGSRAVEIGCGPQGCLELLSSRVGPAGSVVGIELSEEAVQLARKFLS